MRKLREEFHAVLRLTILLTKHSPQLFTEEQSEDDNKIDITSLGVFEDVSQDMSFVIDVSYD